jgi:hypothetical protein
MVASARKRAEKGVQDKGDATPKSKRDNKKEVAVEEPEDEKSSESDDSEEESAISAPTAMGKKLKSGISESMSFFKLGSRMLKAGKATAKNLKSHRVVDNDAATSSSSSNNGSNSKKGGAFVVASEYKKASNAIEDAQSGSKLYDGKIASTHSLLKKNKHGEDGGKLKKSLGKGWFNTTPAEMTSELKNDMKVVAMRNYLDPKRFYKNPDKMKNVIGVGTVIEGPDEFTTQRLTRKERKQSLVGEILADKTIKDYTKRKYAEIQNEKEKSSKKKKKMGQRAGVGSGARKVRKLY